MTWIFYFLATTFVVLMMIETQLKLKRLMKSNNRCVDLLQDLVDYEEGKYNERPNFIIGSHSRR